MTDSTSTADETGPDGTVEDGSRPIDTALPGNAALSVPATASRSETAAIAAAVGAHLRDHAVVVAEATVEEAQAECDRWKLCGRLRTRNPPRSVAHGEEWKAAGRSWR